MRPLWKSLMTRSSHTDLQRLSRLFGATMSTWRAWRVIPFGRTGGGGELAKAVGAIAPNGPGRPGQTATPAPANARTNVRALPHGAHVRSNYRPSHAASAANTVATYAIVKTIACESMSRSRSSIRFANVRENGGEVSLPPYAATLLRIGRDVRVRVSVRALLREVLACRVRGIFRDDPRSVLRFDHARKRLAKEPAKRFRVATDFGCERLRRIRFLVRHLHSPPSVFRIGYSLSMTHRTNDNTTHSYSIVPTHSYRYVRTFAFVRIRTCAVTPPVAPPKGPCALGKNCV